MVVAFLSFVLEREREIKREIKRETIISILDGKETKEIYLRHYPLASDIREGGGRRWEESNETTTKHQIQNNRIVLFKHKWKQERLGRRGGGGRQEENPHFRSIKIMTTMNQSPRWENERRKNIKTQFWHAVHSMWCCFAPHTRWLSKIKRNYKERENNRHQNGCHVTEIRKQNHGQI